MYLECTQLHDSDERILREIHVRQCANGGFDFPFPELHDPRFMVKLALRDADGNLRGAIFGYMRCEAWAIADSPDVCRAVVGMGERLKVAFKGAGVNFVHCFVPNVVARSMSAILKRVGLAQDNSEYTMFSGRIE